MFLLEKTFRFEAGHSLVHHDGKCKSPHGHSYVLTVQLQAETLVESGPKTNMVIDFSDISAQVKKIITTHFDHKWLNETLGSDSPTSEYIARWIFEHLQPNFPQLHAVSLQETATSKVTYIASSNREGRGGSAPL